MFIRSAKLWVAVGLLVTLWGLSKVRQTEGARLIRPIGSRPGPVRILQFTASVGLLTLGQKAELCYGVENAKTVMISPMLPGVYPSTRRCLDILPEHTTHYMIMAEGYDGQVATRSFTLSVQDEPVSSQSYNVAEFLRTTSFTHKRSS